MGRALKEVVIIIVAVIAAIYLINPTAGVIELLPDNIPLVGNLDEGAAVTLLLSTLSYYGVDVNRLYGRKEKPKVRRIVRTVDGEILEDKIVDEDEV